MKECLQNKRGVPQWYGVMLEHEMIAGAGVIENDFHLCKELTPNVCALYVEKRYRNQGIAKALLDFVCADMKRMGMDTLYLISDHTCFYERCGWRFLKQVQEENSAHMTRMYIHR